MRTTRVGALVAGSALSLGLLAPSPAAIAADPEPKPLTDSVAWLEGQLGANGLVPGFSGTGDYSATAGYALGLHELGLTAERNEVLEALVAAKGDFIGDGVAEARASVAAQALWASAQLGSVDAAAQSRLEAQVLNADEVGSGEYSANAVGRVVETPYSEWTGTITQVWAVAALEEVGSNEADEALEFLLKQQCDDGSFRFKWSGPAAADQSCEGDPTSYADIDSTAYVLILLGDLAAADLALQGRLEEAADWLAATQSTTDGSFDAGFGASANSTGLAARALAAAGRGQAAMKAASWVLRRQATSYANCPTPLTADRGAIALDDTALRHGVSSGIGAARGSWQLATVESFAALKLAAPIPVSQPIVAGPVGYQQAATSVTYTVAGAVPSTVLCFAADSVVKGVLAGANGAASVKVTLPAGTATRSVVAVDRSGARGSTSTNVLGTKTIPLRVAKKVKRKRKLNVLVSGLAPREKVSVQFRKRVYRGAASPAGTFIARIKVGPHRGKVKVRVAGQFPAIRNNVKTVRVVR